VAGVADHLKDQLLGLGKKKPDRATLRQRIVEALNSLPGQLRPDSKAAVDKDDTDAVESS
jgi:hypothetical protein